MSLRIKLKICFYLLSIYLHKNRTFNFLSNSIIHLFIISTTGFSITHSWKQIILIFFFKWKKGFGSSEPEIIKVLFTMNWKAKQTKNSVQTHTTLGTFFEAQNPWHTRGTWKTFNKKSSFISCHITTFKIFLVILMQYA